MDTVTKSDTYSPASENRLIKSTENLVRMKSQSEMEGKEPRWKIVRIYKGQFSCVEAIERLIKIHMDTKEDAACQTKK